MTICPCGSSGKVFRHGSVRTCWRDLEDGRSVEIEGRAQRLRCSCGRAWSEPPPDLRSPYRMTGRLVDALFERALDRSFREAGRELGLPETTVRDVFNSEADRLLSEERPAPAIPVVRASASGGETFALAADGEEGVLVDAFEGLADPRLRAFLAKQEGRIHADWHSGPTAATVIASRERVTVHRLSAAARARRTLPDCAEKLAKWHEGETRREIRSISGLLGVDPFELSLKDSAAIRQASATVPALAPFLRVCDALLACFDAADDAEARQRYATWRAALKGQHIDCFEPAFKCVERNADLVFNEGYGAIPGRTWRTIESIELAREPKETPKKTVTRTVAALSRARPDPAPSPIPRFNPF